MQDKNPSDNSPLFIEQIEIGPMQNFRDCYLNIDNREYRLLLLTTLLSYVLP